MHLTAGHQTGIEIAPRPTAQPKPTIAHVAPHVEPAGSAAFGRAIEPSQTAAQLTRTGRRRDILKRRMETPTEGGAVVAKTLLIRRRREIVHLD